MICKTCADAAARRAPRDQHCTDPTCPCGHRTDRYRPIDTPGWSTTLHEAGAHAAQQLTAQLLTQWVPACENGRHYDHPGETCDEYEAYCKAVSKAWENTFGAILATHLTPISEVAAALRGPNGPQAEDDPAPTEEAAAFIGTDALLHAHLCAQEKAIAADNWHQLVHGIDPAPPRRLAAVTRALGPAFWEVVRRDPRADIPPYDPITGYRTWAELEADPPQFTGILAHYEQHAADTDAHTARVEAAIARVEAEHGPDDIIRIPRAAADRCRAEFHHPTMQSARCDLPAGHTDLHREQPDPDRAAFRWDDSVAMYPTDTTKD